MDGAWDGTMGHEIGKLRWEQTPLLLSIHSCIFGPRRCFGFGLCLDLMNDNHYGSVLPRPSCLFCCDNWHRVSVKFVLLSKGEDSNNATWMWIGGDDAYRYMRYTAYNLWISFPNYLKYSIMVQVQRRNHFFSLRRMNCDCDVIRAASRDDDDS